MLTFSLQSRGTSYDLSHYSDTDLHTFIFNKLNLHTGGNDITPVKEIKVYEIDPCGQSTDTHTFTLNHELSNLDFVMTTNGDPVSSLYSFDLVCENDVPVRTHNAEFYATLDDVGLSAFAFVVPPVGLETVRSESAVIRSHSENVNSAFTATKENSEPLHSSSDSNRGIIFSLWKITCAIRTLKVDINLQHCLFSDNSLPLSNGSVSTHDIALSHISTVESEQVLASSLSGHLCSSNKNTQLTVNTLCRLNQDTAQSDFERYENLIYEAESLDYVPYRSSTFQLIHYDTTNDERHVKASNNDNHVYRLSNEDDLTRSFEMKEYLPLTFYIPMTIFPEYKNVNLEKLATERRWQFLHGQQLATTESISRSNTIISKYCSAMNKKPSVLGRTHKCSAQEGAEPVPQGLTPFVDPVIIVDITPPGGNAETIIVPTQEVYKVKNEVIATLEDGTPLDISNVSLSFDSDSHSWTWSGQLVSADQSALLSPTSNGTDVTVYVTINGNTWHLLSERVQKKRTFNSTVISISGRGITARLAEPYQPTSSVEISEDLLNVQIAESFLPTGWSLTWGLDTWLIPANTYSHQNLTPLQALQKVVQECGGMLVPRIDSQVIDVVKRYPVMPWLFASATPDLIVPDDIVLQLSEEPVTTYGANGVHVHGYENGGQQAFCRITGTAGDRLATTVTSNMITDSTAARAVGERALAGAYPQPKTKSITTIMDGDVIDLVQPGTFVEFQVDDVQDRGIVNTVNISSGVDNEGVVTVTQTIGIGETTENTYTIFTELLPKDPVMVVEVVSVTSNTSLVEQVDGSLTRVRGVGTVGSKYYVSSGQIQTDAPDLTILPDIIV